MEDWRRYEHRCIDHHGRRRPESRVYHFSQVGEEVLRESGWIPEGELSMRNVRLARLKNRGFQEYGLDGIARNPDGSYTGIQVKLYRRRMLTASDIATFVGTVAGYIQVVNEDRGLSPPDNEHGVLYFPPETVLYDRLEREMQQSWRRRGLGYDRVEFQGYAPRFPDTDDDDHVKDESTLVPRQYQLDAVEALCRPECPKASLLVMPCGTGKTLVGGLTMQRLDPDVVVIASPLVVSTVQNAERMKPFLLRHHALLACHEGTTSCEDMQTTLRDHARVVISTTYKTAHDVLGALRDMGRSYTLVVDEAHNLTSADHSLWDLINGADRAVLMTATPPRALEELYDIRIGFRMTFAEALVQGVVCDYRLWIPQALTPENFPVELSRFRSGDELAAKAFFLVGGLLRTGAKRTISYLRTKRECAVFASVLNDVCSQYFGVGCHANIVVDDTSSKQRTAFLREFEHGTSTEVRVIQETTADGSCVETKHQRVILRFLLSVRILDEAIDIPSCDSIFVGHMSSTTTRDDRALMRLIQRLHRAGRVYEKTKPDNLCHAFLWYHGHDHDNHDALLDTLGMLREHDPLLATKVCVASARYDAVGTTATREVEEVDLQNFRESYLMQAVEYGRKGIVRWKVRVFCALYADEKPKKVKITADFDGHSIEWNPWEWLHSILGNWLGGHVGTSLSPEQKRSIEALPWFGKWLDNLRDQRAARASTYQLTVADKVELLCRDFSSHKPKDGKMTADFNGHSIVWNPGTWLHCIKANWLGGHVITTLSPEQKRRIEALGWFDEWSEGVRRKRGRENDGDDNDVETDRKRHCT